MTYLFFFFFSVWLVGLEAVTGNLGSEMVHKRQMFVFRRFERLKKKSGSSIVKGKGKRPVPS